MSNNPRDTQFTGFAKVVLDKLLDKCDELDTELDIVDGCVMCNLQRDKLLSLITPLVARAAYDLVEHTVNAVNEFSSGPMAVPEDLFMIPDLATWPGDEK